MKTLVKFMALFLLACFGPSSFAQNGAELFKANCGYCHSIGKGVVVGPDLKGSHARYPEKWLVKWIKSSQTLVQEGDKKAVELFKKYDEVVMPDSPLSDDEVKSIIAYIKAESGGDEPVQVAASSASSAAPGEPQKEQESVPVTTAPEKAPVTVNASSASQEISPVDAANEAPVQAASVSSGSNTEYFLIVGIMAVFVFIVVILGNIIRSLARELGQSHNKV